MSPSDKAVFEQLRADCDVMLLWIGSVGQAIPAAALSQLRVAEAESDLIALADAHQQLSRVVAPATPLSLRVTTAERSVFAIIRKVPLLLLILGLGALFTAGYVGCLIWAEEDAFQACVASTAPAGKDDAPVVLELQQGRAIALKQVAYACAAGLGAIFFTLFTMHRYLVAGTYDPRYSVVYFTRVFLGMIAGVILANFIDTDGLLPDVGPTTLAMLGGYGADAVNRILRSLVDAMARAAGHAPATAPRSSQAIEPGLLAAIWPKLEARMGQTIDEKVKAQVYADVASDASGQPAPPSTASVQKDPEK